MRGLEYCTGIRFIMNLFVSQGMFENGLWYYYGLFIGFTPGPPEYF